MKPYQVKLRRSKTFCFFKSIIRRFKRKPDIINLNDQELEGQALFIANHSAASGPFTYELFFPRYFIPWGTHEMCGNYAMRWNYLYHVFYRQKLKYHKFKAFVLATGFACISKLLYDATGLIGTYRDARLKNTFQRSFDVLNHHIPILIFPENSANGYFDKPSQFHSGFVSLAKLYYKKTNIDLPVYNVYYSKEKNKIVIDKPLKINSLLLQGLSEDEIAQKFLQLNHHLFENFMSDVAL